MSPAQLYSKFRRSTVLIYFRPSHIVIIELFLIGDINNFETYTLPSYSGGRKAAKSHLICDRIT